jgi:hypothetical protein
MVIMEAAARQIAFIPSLGMAWRSMWGLALVPAVIEEPSEVDTSADA